MRVYRDELVTFQVDGTLESAIARLRECKTQHRVNTPKPVWSPDTPNPINFYEDWEDVPDNILITVLSRNGRCFCVTFNRG